MTNNINENKKIELTITDNNKTVNIDFDNVENTIRVHNLAEESHPKILNKINSLDEKIIQYSAKSVNDDSIVLNKCLELEQNILINKAGDATYRYAVATPQEDTDAVNKAYLTDYLNNTLNELNGNLFDIKISDHLISDESWQISNGEWLTRENFPKAYNYLVNQYNNSINHTDNISYIKDNTVTNKNINYYRSTLNYKIVASETDFTSADNLFTATGSSWYYQIDTENQQFKLPRTTNFFQLTTEINELCNFIEAGVPNITGSFEPLGQPHAGTGAFSNSSGSILYGSGYGSSTNAKYNFNASLSNKLFGNSSTIQPRANKMLLYFKVK